VASSRELVKLYYRIGEVAQIVGVQPHVLRYWETEFRTIRPQKSHKGQRVYSRRDVEKLLKVKDLLKNQGFTIAGAKKKLREPEPQAMVELAAEKVAEVSPALAPAPEPVQIAAAGSLRVLAADEVSRAKVRDALLALREDIASMLDEFDAPPRRPKLPHLP
jgi:DNA-binding transcriptional MerR regulator